MREPAVPDSVNRWPGSRTWRLAFGTCMAAVLVLSLLPIGPDMPTTGWDKTNHLLAFSVLALLGCRSYPGRITTVLAGLLVYGALIEGLQSLTSYRFAEWGDLVADGLGLVLGWAWTKLAARVAPGRDRQSPRG